MDRHHLVEVLVTARASGVTLRLVDGHLRVDADVPPEAKLIAELKRYGADIKVMAQASNALDVSLIWCAQQLGPEDEPADFGYPCIHHYLELCLERWRAEQRLDLSAEIAVVRTSA